MSRILIVEDEKPISELIRLCLSKAGYHCDCVYDGEAAADRLEQTSFDLILLDIMLPHVNGFELMEYIRPLEIPVIFLTAMHAVDDRVKGLRMGAEDYIVKPFALPELLARVDVVLRRYKKGETQLCIAGLEIDMRSMRVSRDGEVLLLTPKEYELLLLFARNPNRALYRDSIYEQVWGGELAYGSKTVDLHVQRLRKKAHWECELQAVNKVGYRLLVEP